MTDLQPEVIIPDWPAPANVKAVISTRIGGVSKGVYAGCNMALHVADNPDAVAANRAAVLQEVNAPGAVQWLEQIHGTRVVEAETAGRIITADGVITADVGRVCAVLTADCLPVLLCSKEGEQVAAVHAGWRGLASGIVREAVAQFTAAPAQLMAYLGPAIGPSAFEVGVDVLEAFFASAQNADHADAVALAFSPAKKPLHFCADLYALARAELSVLGVQDIYGGAFCTYTDSQRFYSYRRDGETGRMASMIWRDA